MAKSLQDLCETYVVNYDGDHAGKMAHYMMRWSMRDGSASLWAETRKRHDQRIMC